MILLFQETFQVIDPPGEESPSEAEDLEDVELVVVQETVVVDVDESEDPLQGLGVQRCDAPSHRIIERTDG